MALAAGIAPWALNVPLCILAQLRGVGKEAQVPALGFFAYVRKGQSTQLCGWRCVAGTAVTSAALLLASTLQDSRNELDFMRGSVYNMNCCLLLHVAAVLQASG